MKVIEMESSIKHPSKSVLDKIRQGYPGFRGTNPYDDKFSSEEEKESAVAEYQSQIDRKETKLSRNADQSRQSGGYDNWHKDKDSIGYMYDRIELMKKARLKESLKESSTPDYKDLVRNKNYRVIVSGESGKEQYYLAVSLWSNEKIKIDKDTAQDLISSLGLLVDPYYSSRVLDFYVLPKDRVEFDTPAKLSVKFTTWRDYLDMDLDGIRRSGVEVDVEENSEGYPVNIVFKGPSDKLNKFVKKEYPDKIKDIEYHLTSKGYQRVESLKESTDSAENLSDKVKAALDKKSQLKGLLDVTSTGETSADIDLTVDHPWDGQWSVSTMKDTVESTLKELGVSYELDVIDSPNGQWTTYRYSVTSGLKESADLVSKSTSTLKKMLKDADEDTKRKIWAELNCRGVYAKGKGPKSGKVEEAKKSRKYSDIIDPALARAKEYLEDVPEHEHVEFELEVPTDIDLDDFWDEFQEVFEFDNNIDYQFEFKKIVGDVVYNLLHLWKKDY